MSEETQAKMARMAAAAAWGLGNHVPYISSSKLSFVCGLLSLPRLTQCTRAIKLSSGENGKRSCQAPLADRNGVQS